MIGTWTVDIDPESPQQMNEHDCGDFLIANTYALALKYDHYAEINTRRARMWIMEEVGSSGCVSTTSDHSASIVLLPSPPLSPNTHTPNHPT